MAAYKLEEVEAVVVCRLVVKVVYMLEAVEVAAVELVFLQMV